MTNQINNVSNQASTVQDNQLASQSDIAQQLLNTPDDAAVADQLLQSIGTSPTPTQPSSTKNEANTIMKQGVLGDLHLTVQDEDDGGTYA